MPELIEVELYRRALEPLGGARLDAIDLRDAAYLRPEGADPAMLDDLVGMRMAAIDRIGKLLLIDLADDVDDVERRSAPESVTTIGLRFGMTGRLLVDGSGPIEKLEYASGRNDPDWDRIRITFGGRVVAIRDPRRLGSLDLMPDTSRLGPDATIITEPLLQHSLASREASVKALLLNQGIIAGLGNLLTDEILWTARIAPHRAGGALSATEVKTLHGAIVQTLEELTERRGSHTGQLFAERHREGVCPRDGALLHYGRFGGRGTWWCPAHQE